MSSMSPGSIAGTVLFVAPARLTTLIFASCSTVLALEIARRGFRAIAELVITYNEEKGVGKFVKDWTPEVVDKMLTAIEPPKTEAAAAAGKGISNRQLLRSFIICAVIANIGWEFSKFLSGGEISGLYNQAARFVGPLVLDTTYRHPVIQFGVDMAKQAVPSLA